MKPSQLFFDILEHFEGCKLTAYKDIAGIWTIGYGTTCYPNGSHVQEGETCTQDEAKLYLLSHLNGIVDHLNATTPNLLNQPKFDSLCDFTYNTGQGAWDGSSLRKVVNSSPTNYGEITNDFCKWDKAHVNGELVEVEGLLRRRKCEAYLYTNGVNHPTFFLPHAS